MINIFETKYIKHQQKGAAQLGAKLLLDSVPHPSKAAPDTLGMFDHV